MAVGGLANSNQSRLLANHREMAIGGLTNFNQWRRPTAQSERDGGQGSRGSHYFNNIILLLAC